jgi:hypothetical protein
MNVIGFASSRPSPGRRENFSLAQEISVTLGCALLRASKDSGTHIDIIL